MSPAAVDVPSPVTSNSFSLQNPNRSPFHPPTSSSDDYQETINPLIFCRSSEFSVSDGVLSGSDPRKGSVAAGRSRPRMVKVRKQLHGRLRGASSEFGNGLGLNPFQSGAESSSCGNDCCSSENGFVVENLSSAVSSYSGERLFDLKVEASSSNVESEKLENAGFVFAAKGIKVENEVKPGLKEENGKFSNAGFVFGARGNNAKTKSDLDNIESKSEECGSCSGFPHAGKMNSEAEVGNAKDDFAGFKFGAGKGDAGSGLYFEKGESNTGGFVFGTNHNSYSTKIRFSDTGFVFNGSWFDSNGKAYGGSLKNLASNGTGKIEVEGETIPEIKFNINGTNKWMMYNDNVQCVQDRWSRNSSSSGECMATNSTPEAQNDCLGTNINFKYELPSFRKNNMSAIDLECDLSDKMKKLDVDGFEDVDATNNRKPSANDNPLFVFRGNKMEEASTNEISGSIYKCNSEGVYGAAKGTAGEKFESTNMTERSDDSGSTSTSDRSGGSFMDFKSPEWDPSSLKASLFPELNKKVKFSVKARPRRDKKSKIMRGKSKQSPQHQEEIHVENKSSAQDALNSIGCYSPMDCSPYEETTAAEKFSRGTSMTSNDSIHPNNSCGSSFLRHTVADNLKDDEVLDIDKSVTTNARCSHSEGYSIGDSPAMVFGFKMSCSGSNTEQVFSSTAGVTSAEDESTLNTEKSHKIQFDFASGLEDIDGRKFSFSASSSTRKSVSAAKHVYRKKFRRKVTSEPFVAGANPNVKDQEEELSASQRTFRNDSEANDQVKRGSASSTIAVEKACETWRLRGNYAYKNGDLSKAEDAYTRGIKSVLSSETSGSCLKPLVICYSNRAATRMCLGNMREALKDCGMAAALDPSFVKVLMRAANCHLALGEVEEAQSYFCKCLESGAGVCLDRRITIEAATGLQKSQKVAKNINQSSRLLDERTSDAALSALDVIAEALSISPLSERLLEMKAESMFMLRRYEEVIQLCQQTMHDAEKNFTSSDADDQFVDKDVSQTEILSFAKLWRWHLISKSYFYLGRLEAALDLLEKLEPLGSINDKCASKIQESSISLAVTIRTLLHYKSGGNEAVRSGRYMDALEHYTAAISSNIESRPFAAICFCNRAAAHQALGQIADAIADCSLAIALDGNYSKAVSRRATLHEMIRDYGHAATDLQRLLRVLENMSNRKGRKSGTPSRSASSSKELRQAQRRLSLIEEEAKKGISLDLYLILGVKQSDTATDIKKAYRKAALKHHPDKAGQFLARSESGEDGRLWKDIVQEVHMDADRLFKMIGEAYTVLSDPSKRSKYDIEEEISKVTKECNASHPYQRPADGQSYSYRKSGHRQENWRTYGQSRSRW